ncbi:amino acid permease [Kineococcus sp. T13]|uniref:APC family permease n=1 Tax=Kineococcus vitellinus TaxID=2696565 RepID=UPI001411F950|nr:APC family permease [Kineococcus vitellinus]NAZ74249.1 amino acid permease [Kineococcus vitellinus]
MTEPGAPAQQPATGLRGSIGVPGIVFLVVASAAPLTAIGGALPVMLALGNAAGTPVAYLAVAAVLLLFSVGYAAMSRHVTDTGAFFAYVTRGLGRAPGLGAAGLALLTYTAIQAGIYGLAASTLQSLAVRYGGPQLPWWAWAAILLAVVGFLGYRNIDLGAKILGVLLVLEIGVVALLSAAILLRGGPEGASLDSFEPTTFASGSPGIALMFAIASFIGFEATAIYGEEARNPRRTVPIATYVAVVLIGVFYAFASWAVVVAVGPSRVQAVAGEHTADLVIGVLSARYLGTFGAHVLPVLLFTSLFAALLAFHNAIARYCYALGRVGALPHLLSRTHHRYRSPHTGSLAQTVCALVVLAAFTLAGADPVAQLFTWMSGLATLSVLVLMLLACAAVLVFFARGDIDRRAWNTRVAPALGGVGLLGVLAAVLANFTTLIGGSTVLAVLLLALVVLAFVAGAASARRPPSAAPGSAAAATTAAGARPSPPSAGAPTSAPSSAPR